MNEIFNTVLAQKFRKDRGISKNSSKNDLLISVSNAESNAPDNHVIIVPKVHQTSINTLNPDIDNYSRGLDFDLFKLALK